MSFNGIILNKTEGGLPQGSPADRVCCLIIGATMLPGQLEHYTPVELLQIEDLEAKTVTAENDLKIHEMLYYHVSEYFRLSPESNLWLIPVPKTEKVSTLSASVELRNALRGIPNLNTVAFASLEPDETLAAAVAAAQLMADDFTADHIYMDAILIEGTGDYLTGEAVTEFTDLRTLDSPAVSVVIGQDPAVAAQDEEYKKHAAVGAALGMLAVRSVHENLGSVDIETKPRQRKAEQDYTLTDTKRSRFLSAALSNGREFKTLTGADQQRLDALGYIYIGAFAGYAGFFFSDSHTCTEAGSDYSYIERNAIWNKAARLIRTTLIPRIRGKVEADPQTGYIKSTTIAAWDGLVRKSLESLKKAADVADVDIYIDPKQAAVSRKPFSIKVILVADGIVHEFEVDLGFTNKLN